MHIGITAVGVQVMGFRYADSSRFPLDDVIYNGTEYGAYGQDSSQDEAARQAEFWSVALGQLDSDTPAIGTVSVATVYRSRCADTIGQLMDAVPFVTCEPTGNEIALSECNYGCKIYNCKCGTAHVFHNRTYGCPR